MCASISAGVSGRGIPTYQSQNAPYSTSAAAQIESAIELTSPPRGSFEYGTSHVNTILPECRT